MTPDCRPRHPALFVLTWLERGLLWHHRGRRYYTLILLFVLPFWNLASCLLSVQTDQRGVTFSVRCRQQTEGLNVVRWSAVGDIWPELIPDKCCGLLTGNRLLAPRLLVLFKTRGFSKFWRSPGTHGHGSNWQTSIKKHIGGIWRWNWFLQIFCISVKSNNFQMKSIFSDWLLPVFDLTEIIWFDWFQLFN